MKDILLSPVMPKPTFKHSQGKSGQRNVRLSNPGTLQKPRSHATTLYLSQQVNLSITPRDTPKLVNDDLP